MIMDHSAVNGTLTEEVQLGYALEAFGLAHQMGVGWTTEWMSDDDEEERKPNSIYFSIGSPVSTTGPYMFSYCLMACFYSLFFSR